MSPVVKVERVETAASRFASLVELLSISWRI
jgi:hypothetical protein